VTIFPSALALVALSALAFARQAGPVAPDGRRGFGARAELSEVLATVRSTRDAERALLAELDGLPSELSVLVAGAMERYRERGYLALLDPSREAAMPDVHRVLEQALGDPLANFAAVERSAELRARLVSDLRLRLRRQVTTSLELESLELRRGLAVLRGATEGFVLLTPDEAMNIAARIDLAASFLRAMRNDLRALRQGGDEAEIARRAETLLALARASEGEQVRRAGLARELETLASVEDAMSAVTFTVRLRTSCRELLDWRARIFSESTALRDEALLWLPDSDIAKQAPPDVQKLSRSERMRGARLRAQQALALDPLDPEAVWAYAHATDFQFGIVESRPWYDRFLALRGIRSHDHRTYAERKLDLREREALDTVQRGLYGGPGTADTTGQRR
jgi:hypothetical protein